MACAKAASFHKFIRLGCEDKTRENDPTGTKPIFLGKVGRDG